MLLLEQNLSTSDRMWHDTVVVILWLNETTVEDKIRTDI